MLRKQFYNKKRNRLTKQRGTIMIVILFIITIITQQIINITIKLIQLIAMKKI